MPKYSISSCFNLVTSNNLINYHLKSKLKENRKSKSEWDLHDSSSESDSISLVVTNRNLNTQQSQYFDALDTIEENEEESTDDDLSDLDVSFSVSRNSMDTITKDGSVNALPQILYGQYLILGAFRSYIF